MELPFVEEAANRYGGVTSRPRFTIEKGPNEVIYVARSLRDQSTYVSSSLRRYHLPDTIRDWNPANCEYDPVQAIITPDYEEVWRYKVGREVWIHEGETYDPKTNTLTLKGHIRIYAFDVWTENSAEVN